MRAFRDVNGLAMSGYQETVNQIWTTSAGQPRRTLVTWTSSWAIRSYGRRQRTSCSLQYLHLHAHTHRHKHALFKVHTWQSWFSFVSLMTSEPWWAYWDWATLSFYTWLACNTKIKSHSKYKTMQSLVLYSLKVRVSLFGNSVPFYKQSWMESMSNWVKKIIILNNILEVLTWAAWWSWWSSDPFGSMMTYWTR